MNTLQQSILKIWPVTGKCQMRRIMLLALMIMASYLQVNAQNDPTKPVVYATSITDTGMEISWDPSTSSSSSIESYQLVVTENGSTTPKETISSATSPHTLTGLDQNTAYLITVKAVDAIGSYALSTISKATLDPAYNGVGCPLPGQVPGNNSSNYGARIIGNGVGQEFSSAPWDNNPETYVTINTTAQPRPTPILQCSWVSSNVFADRLFISIRNGNYPTKILIKGEDPARTLVIDLFSIDNPQFTSDGQFLAEWVIPPNTDLGRYSIYFTDYTFPNDPMEINSLTFFHSQCRNSVNPPAGYNEPIPPVDITVPPSKPIVSVIKTEQTLIDISWTTTTPLAEIESYQLTATSTYGTEVTNIPSDQSTYRLENLEAGTAYEIKLTVKGNNGLFSDEEIINETTLASPDPRNGTGGTGIDICLSAKEKTLYLAINQLRADNGLTPIPLSYKLTKVAQLHAKDIVDNPICDDFLHNWSDCCIDTDGWDCISNKPRELTDYTGDGFEISAATGDFTGNLSAQPVVDGWATSPKHRNVILNINGGPDTDWSAPWNAMGVGMYQGVAHAWFGRVPDGEVFATADAITCTDPDPAPPKAVVNFSTENITCNSGQIKISFGNDTNLADYQVMVADNAAMTGAQQIALTGSFDVYHTVDGLNSGTVSVTYVEVTPLLLPDEEKSVTPISFTTLTAGCDNDGGGNVDNDTCPYPGETFDGYSGTFSRFLQGNGSGPVGAPDVWDQNPETYVHVDWVMDFWVMWHYYSRNVYADRVLITIKNGAYPNKIEIKGIKLDQEGYTLGDVGDVLHTKENPQFSSEGQYVAELEIPANTELNRYWIKFSNGTTTGENIRLNTINFWHSKCNTPPAEYVEDDGGGSAPPACVTVAQPTGLDVNTIAVVGDGTEYELQWVYDAAELAKVGTFEIALSGPASFNETYTVDASNVNLDANTGLISLMLNNYWTNIADGNYTVTVTAVSPDNCSRVSSDPFSFDVTDPADGKYLVIRPAQCTSQKINWGLGNTVNPAEYTVNITLNSEAPIQVSDASSEHTLVGLTSGTNYTVSINAVHNTTGELIDLGSESFNTLTAGCDDGGTGDPDTGGGDVTCPTDTQIAIFNDINNYRAANGLAKLSLRSDIVRIAEIHARDNVENQPCGISANELSHNWSGQGEWAEWFDGSGDCYTYVANPDQGFPGIGEQNLAGRYDAPTTTVVTQWQASPGHNANMLNSCTTCDVGIAYYKDPVTNYTVYSFILSDASQALADASYIEPGATPGTCWPGTDPPVCITVAQPTGLDVTTGAVVGDGTEYELQWVYDAAELAKVGTFEIALSGPASFNETYIVDASSVNPDANTGMISLTLNNYWTNITDGNYTVTVTAVSPDQCSTVSSDAFAFDVTDPADGAFIAIRTAQCNAQVINWGLGNNINAADYVINISLDPSTINDIQVIDGSGEYTIQGLPSGTSYTVSIIAAHKTSDDVIDLGTESFETLSEGCVPEVTVTDGIPNCNSVQISLNFRDDISVTDYQVEMSYEASMENPELIPLTTNNTLHNIEGLSAGTEHTIYLKATNLVTGLVTDLGSMTLATRLEDCPVDHACLDKICEHIIIDDAGNVGIGKIPDPDYKLDVDGPINASELYIDGISTGHWTKTDNDISYSDGNVGIGNVPNPTMPLHVEGSVRINNGGIMFTDTDDSGRTITGVNTIYGQNTGGASGLLDFKATSNVHSTFGMRLTDSGLGVGTIDPSEKLEVAGNIKATSFIGDGSQLTSLNAFELTGPLPTLDATNLTNLDWNNIANVPDDLGLWEINSDGKTHTNNEVQIGGFPSNGGVRSSLELMGALHVRNQAWHRQFITIGSNAPDLGGDQPGSDNYILSQEGDLKFYMDGDFDDGVAPQVAMTITREGNIGIGTVGTPSEKLEVAGTIDASGYLLDGKPFNTGSSESFWSKSIVTDPNTSVKKVSVRQKLTDEDMNFMVETTIRDLLYFDGEGTIDNVKDISGSNSKGLNLYGTHDDFRYKRSAVEINSHASDVANSKRLVKIFGSLEAGSYWLGSAPVLRDHNGDDGLRYLVVGNGRTHDVVSFESDVSAYGNLGVNGFLNVLGEISGDGSGLFNLNGSEIIGDIEGTFKGIISGEADIDDGLMQKEVEDAFKRINFDDYVDDDNNGGLGGALLGGIAGFISGGIAGGASKVAEFGGAALDAIGEAADAIEDAAEVDKTLTPWKKSLNGIKYSRTGRGVTIGIASDPTSTTRLKVNGKTEIDGRLEAAQLTVNGRANVEGDLVAVRVVATPKPSEWSDFVFADDYKLPALAEVEQFIKTNKHLPEVPSAKQIGEDGLDLGKMDATLLQKIEELTLYIIEQNKQLKAQSKKLESQYQQLKEMAEFQKRLEMLEKLLVEKNK